MLVQALSLVTSLLVISPNIIIVYKLFTRPVIHTLFNISLGYMFFIFTFLGPFLAFFLWRIILEERSSFNCARFMEIRVIILESLKVISMNVLFRFFFVVHAEKGLVVSKSYFDNKLKCSDSWAKKPFTDEHSVRTAELYGDRDTPAHVAGLSHVERGQGRDYQCYHFLDLTIIKTARSVGF